MADLFFLPFRPAYDNNLKSVPGAQIWFTLEGTNTPYPIYQDEPLTTPHTNPVVADAIGRFPAIYMDEGVTYRVRIYDADAIPGVDSPIEDYDPYSGVFEDTNYIADAADAVTRPVEDKLRETVSLKDFGALGDNATNDADAIENAFASGLPLLASYGYYQNTTVTLTLPFGQILRFQSGADIISSGSGSETYSGVVIRENHNPDNLTGWTDTAALSYEGLSVDFGGYGPRSFGPEGTPTALNGSINVPASATIPNHASGVTGFVKSASIVTGGVALFGEANREADDVLVWGLNTVTYDHGHGGLNVWGAEIDLNIDNVTTTVVGLDLVGASTVTPASSVAIVIQALGVFTTPKKPWQYGFLTRDGSCVVGAQIGSIAEVANSGSQPIQLMYRNAANVAAIGFAVQVDGSGGALVQGGNTGGFMSLRHIDSSAHNIIIGDDALSFFGNVAVAKQVVSGSRGSGAALQSLLDCLEAYGLIVDSTSA